MKFLLSIGALLCGMLISMLLPACADQPLKSAPASLPAPASMDAASAPAPATFPANWKHAQVDAMVLIVRADYLDDFGYGWGMDKGVAVQSLDNWRLNITLRALYADRRLVRSRAPVATLHRNELLSLVFSTQEGVPGAATQKITEEYGTFHLTFSVDSVGPVLHAKFIDLSQTFERDAAADPAHRGTLVIPKPGFPLEGSCRLGDTFFVVGPRLEFPDKNNKAILLLIRVKSPTE